MMDGVGLRVAIVGAGIGGMVTALALLRKGIEVSVFEQASQLGEIGAGVLITPNSLRLLDRMGLGSELAAMGGPVGEGSSYFRKDGTFVAPILTTDSSGWNGMYGMHRADLLALLAEVLPAGVVRVGHKCVGFDQKGDTATLIFEGGQQVEADVVVAADGIHSVLQKYVTQPSPPIHSGSVAYRGLIPAEQFPSWPMNVSQLWMGEGKHFLVYPVRSGRLINYVGFVPSDEQALESWSSMGDPVILAREFSGWDPRIGELLSRVKATFWWGLYDREPLNTWTSGRLTLLGDAAHPMLPHLGQGANQSIEDGVALAMLLENVDRDGAPDALLAYEQIRRDRTTKIQLGARTNGARYDSAYEDLDQRDAEIGGSVGFRSWIYDYDAEEAARAVAPAV